MDRSRIIAWLKQHGPAFVLDVVVNIALPVLIYDRMHGRFGDVRALLLSSIPPLLWAVGGFIRNRRIDAVSIIAMAGIALSILAFFGGGSA